MHRSTFALTLSLLAAIFPGGLAAQPYLDNQTDHSNQDPENETRRSDHIRVNFGHYNRDTTAMTEALAQGNLQMYEQMWNRWVIELGLHDLNESSTKPDGNKYRANFNFLMTWNDGGGGGAYMSTDANGFSYAMAQPGWSRFDPPSGATPHEFGHAWEGSCGGFNGSDSSGSWWECTANWMTLQFLNTYPQPKAYLANGIYYPAHGRDYYDSWMIWEAAYDDPRYGAQWVNSVWTNYNADQQVHEFIIDRMIRCDTSGLPDKAGAAKDLWGDMAKKMLAFDFQRGQWLKQANSSDDGSDWEWYQRCRTPLVAMPGSNGWYRPAREHLPMEFGFNFIPLQAATGTTVTCTFVPQGDPVRQSDWRACLVAVNAAGEARYSTLWNCGANSITLSMDQAKLYLVVIATPKPMKIANPAWTEYLTDSGLQFPYAVSFVNAAPRNTVYPAQPRTAMHQHANGGGWVANTATVDATAYVGPEAQVLNTAQVRGNARVEDFAVVRNSAQVRDTAVVSGHAMVQDYAQVYGNAKARDWARVFGYAEVYENAKVIEHANCGEGKASTHTKVYGNAVVKGTAFIYDTSTFNGCLIFDGDSANGNGTTPSSQGVHFGWSWGSDPSRFSSLANNNYLYAQHTFEKDNAVFALDQYGINHGFLINGCRSGIDSQAPARGGWVLPLNGTNQYVELHNSVNDLKDTTVAVWFKRTGETPDQCVWSMGDGAGKVMSLMANNTEGGGLRFLISDSTTAVTLDGGAVAVNTWVHTAIVFSAAGSNITLYVNGTAVTSTATTLFPENLNAPLMSNANYLGRGNSGNHFAGLLDDFRVYMKSLSPGEVLTLYNSTASPAPVTPVADTTAPTPNAATWLESPRAISDSAVTMSATPGTDASGWVEYYFACVSGGGHDSGWVSFNKYTDCGLNPGAPCTYTVAMRDRNGNQTAVSMPGAATLALSTIGTAAFAYGPLGTSDGQITMSAVVLTNASGKVEYTFTSSSGNTSGWRSSPVWTETGLASGGSYSYSVTVRDGRGHVSAASAATTARARDEAAPRLPIPPAHWLMQPYATLDNRISMTAQTASDPAGVQYYFQCTAGGAPDSSWQDSPTYTTPVLADGTYTFRYKLRDKSAQASESGYSSAYSGRITPTTGYHGCGFGQLTALPEDCLVTFTGRVLRVNSNHYVVQDTISAASIIVWPSTYAQATDLGLAFQTVSVSGHLYTYTNAGGRLVSFASLAAIGTSPYSISGIVTNSSGAGLPGVTVYFSSTPNGSANPAGTTMTDATGRYTMPILNGTWYVCAGSASYLVSADRVVMMNSANVTGINFGLGPRPVVSGRVTDLAGSPIAGARVNFSLSPNARTNPAWVATSDSSGNYTQVVDSTTLYVSAGAAGYLSSADRVLAPAPGAVLASVDFALPQPWARNIPQTNQLLFAALADALPGVGPINSWPLYVTNGLSLSAMGTPSAATFGGARWANNKAEGDGFHFRNYPIGTRLPFNGGTIVVAARPVRYTPGNNYQCLVSVDLFQFSLLIQRDTGRLRVYRGGALFSNGPIIPDGQATVFSLVVQPTGQFKVYTNGVLAMTENSTFGFTNLTGTVSYSTDVNLGKGWNGDAWSSFNGYIGDAFVYLLALTDAERQQLEGDLVPRFLGGNTTRTITATGGTGGTIVPSGNVTVLSGTNQTFAITATSSYILTNVMVDGAAQGPISSYTFTNVIADHTISAGFAPITHLITASAGTNGSISPAGATPVIQGTAQTFTFTPKPGYMVDQVLLDGASIGRMGAYTLTNVLADHTISVSFKLLVSYTITASAGSNGTISPAGTVQVPENFDQTFVISPNNGCLVSNVIVDGVSRGPLTSYTFTNVLAPHTIAAAFVIYTPPAPVAFYPLENNVLDTVGTFHGTAYGSPLFVAGKQGLYAIQFNGTSQYVAIPRPVSGSFTIAFWVKTTQTSRTGSNWYNGSGLVDGEVGGVTGDFGITYLNGKVAFGIGNPDTTFQSVSTINSGAWTHVACTRDGGTGQVKIYINGALEITGTGPTGNRATPATLHLGNLQSGGNFFTGVMDHVRFYTSVLSPADISYLASYVPQARLTIVPNGLGGLEISWPDAFTGQLMSSPALGAAADWSSVGGAPSHAAGVYRLTVLPGSTPAFYGLGY